MADLAKKAKAEESPEDKVAKLSQKFETSRGVVNVDYETLCLCSLTGGEVPMCGAIIPDNSQNARSRDGSLGMLVGPSSLNNGIIRWASSRFENFELMAAQDWRQAVKSTTLDGFKNQLDKYLVVVPCAQNLADVPNVVDGLLNDRCLQDVWIHWFTEQLAFPNRISERILRRWKTRSMYMFQEFAPYAWFCARATLMMITAVRHKLVRWDQKHPVDLQYMFYLPFCQVFVSDDLVHERLVPLLCRPKQSFVRGQVLKKDLARIQDEWDILSPEERLRRDYAFGDYPSPARDSIVHTLWKKHCKPWHHNAGNLAAKLSEIEAEKAIREAEAMIREAEITSEP